MGQAPMQLQPKANLTLDPDTGKPYVHAAQALHVHWLQATLRHMPHLPAFRWHYRCRGGLEVQRC